MTLLLPPGHAHLSSPTLLDALDPALVIRGIEAAQQQQHLPGRGEGSPVLLHKGELRFLRAECCLMTNLFFMLWHPPPCT